MKHEVHSKLYNYLLYLTNNERKPVSEWRADEIKFDMYFFIAGLISVIIAFALFIIAVFVYMGGNEKLAWCVVFVAWAIETSILTFLPLWDQIRHNREE